MKKGKAQRFHIIVAIMFGYLLLCTAIISFFSVNDFSIILGMLGIGITLVIATNQAFVIKELKSIGIETRGTAEALRVDSFTRARAKEFFQLNSEANEPYKCIYPHQFSNRPLPSINAGDYYALLVVDRKLGSENLVFHGVSREENIEDDLLTDRVVLVCAHIANPAVKKLFPIHTITSDEDQLSLIREEVPCWFVDDERKGKKRSDDERNEPIRKIRVTVGNTLQLIESPAEDSYIEAARLGGEACNIDGIQEDYGILARIKHNGTTFVILAGIHQYGTWIVAEYLDRLLSKRKGKYNDILMAENDFIGVIWGEFDTESIRVAEAKVHHHYLWQRKGHKWIRCTLKEKAGFDETTITRS